MPRCDHLRLHGFCGLCLSGKKGRASYKGHACYRQRVPFLKGGVNVALSRPVVVSTDVPPPSDADIDLGPALGPTIRSYLCDTKWADGTARQTSTLNLFTEAGRWKAYLNDRAMQRSTCVSATTFVGLLQVLEEALASDRVEWRYQAQQAPRKGR